MKINFFNYKMRDFEDRYKLIDDKERFTRMSDDYEKFGFDYFDNEVDPIGYGGYKYDGRFYDIAVKISQHYKLKPGCKVLEIGCAKGFVTAPRKSFGNPNFISSPF